MKSSEYVRQTFDDLTVFVGTLALGTTMINVAEGDVTHAIEAGLASIAIGLLYYASQQLQDLMNRGDSRQTSTKETVFRSMSLALPAYLILGRLLRRTYDLQAWDEHELVVMLTLLLTMKTMHLALTKPLEDW